MTVKKEPLFAEERKNEIIKYLEKHKKITVPEMCDYFGVSPATIRNDLRELDKARLLKRTHGGAISILQTTYESKAVQKSVENIEQKQRIAMKAAEFVQDGDAIVIDTGTTTLEFAKKLVDKRNITVVTNDIKIADFLENVEGFKIILTGGLVRKGFHCVVGSIALKAIEGLSVDKAFMGTNSLDIEKGATTPDIEQAEIKKCMINIASEVYLLCDSSKMGRKSFVQVVPANKIDILITDEGIHPKLKDALESEGIDVEVAQ